MRNPNGYGGIVKLSGNRRRPYRVRITECWEWKNGHAVQRYKTIGYYASQAEALAALAKYHQDPLKDPDSPITFAELFEYYAQEKEPTLTPHAWMAISAAYKNSKPLHDRQFIGLRRADLQRCIDESGKNYPTLAAMRSLWNQMYNFAAQNDLVDKNYAVLVNITQYRKKHEVSKHKRFRPDEVAVLWSHTDDARVRWILMLIYSGVRIGELLDLKKTDVDLDARIFQIRKSKTSAGIRTVPIARKVLPFWEELMNAEGDRLLPLRYNRAREVFMAAVSDAGLEAHLPHDTRYTCVSMLADAHVEKSIIKRIVGHAGGDVTDDVYTHFDPAILVESIDKI